MTLAKTARALELVRHENSGLRRRVQHLVVTQQRRQLARWCFHALRSHAERAGAATQAVRASRR